MRLLVVAVALSGSLVVRCTPWNHCKAYPGTDSWPSDDAWRKLNQTLEGRLLKPAPPAGVCHTGQPTYNAAACVTLTEQWPTYDFHCEDPVSVQLNQFTNDTCLPDPNAPCSDQGYPPYVINATTPQHVKLGIDFARVHNVRLVVKGTGHDYIGRSTAPGALSIWTHHMKDMTYHSDQFKIAGSGKVISGNSITVGAGVQTYELYVETDKYNQTAVGGASTTVGVVGYVTGAGHSILASRYGLAADNVLEMEIVSPQGEIITINEDQHCDLFWAMRGGGGSTFGVVTSITMQTHPSPKIQAITWAITTSPESLIFHDLITYVASQLPDMNDAGLSGYNRIGSAISSPFPSGPKTLAGVSGVNIIQDAQSPDDVYNIFRPINDIINARWKGEVKLTMTVAPFDSFLDWYHTHHDRSAAGIDFYVVSRLVDRESLTGDKASLSDALQAGLRVPGVLSAFTVAGKGVHNAKPRGGSNAVNPAWRKAYVHAYSSLVYQPFNKTAESETIATLNDSYEPLRELTPDMGAYMNEALRYEKDWQHTFWGSNYPRLRDIKRAVDPDDVLWCFPCVGSERWQESSDGQLCKVS